MNARVSTSKNLLFDYFESLTEKEIGMENANRCSFSVAQDAYLDFDGPFLVDLCNKDLGKEF